MLSVLMSVFWKESPEFLDAALHSIEMQTTQPDEVLSVNGPLGPELTAVLDGYRSRLPLVIVELPEWVGLGEALRIGVEKCRGELIARMDTDDICVPDRLQIQADFLHAHPDVDLVGGAIAEFNQDPEQPVNLRKVPTEHEDIVKIAKLRNPINHMTVMFRREAVLRSGNYHDDAGWEDYRLWARMLMAGCRLHNLDQVLVLARTGEGFMKRRGGMVKLRHELSMQAYFRKIGFISSGRYLFNLAMRTPVIVAPEGVRKLLYERLLRTNLKETN